MSIDPPALPESQGGSDLRTHSPDPQPAETSIINRRITGRGPVLRATLACLVLLGIALVATAWFRPLTLVGAVTDARFWVAGMRGHDVTLEGHRIHYYVGGAGEPIVLVHGLGSRAEDWASLVPSFLHAGYRVYAIDLLGYGDSDQPSDAAYSISQEAGVVRAFLSSQHLDHTVLAGWSMGGWISMRVALDEPQRIRRLIVYDSAGLVFKVNFSREAFVPTTPAELEVLNSMLSPGLPSPIPGFLARDILRRVHSDGWVVQRSLNSMLTGADLLDGRVSALRMPLLIVWGKQDRLTPLSLGEEIHREVQNSTLEVLDGCGHLAPGQCAGGVAAKTLAFLRGSGSANMLEAQQSSAH